MGAMASALQRGIVAVILLFALWVRILVSLHSYSGANDPPRYGDYEAQRHWMEITLHTSVRNWYRNTTDNDLGYWGLDYPPLTAYQSLLHGLALNFFEPASVALYTSRGYETQSSKLLMRWTVLSSDVIVFFPAALAFVSIFLRHKKFETWIWALMMILLQPTLILIDHGHFQFNCISLGLTLGAVAAICSSRDLLASVLFCLALNHKQMSAYFAPAFFAYLLGKSLQQPKPLWKVLKLGMVVFATFLCCWLPFLDSTESVLAVLSRMVPLERGLYEDYVANFWCATSLLIKWKRLLSSGELARLALLATLTSFVPSVVQQIKYPSHKGFLLSMVNTALSFYLFSYQVHEKSILLPLLPASLLILEDPLVYKGLVLCGMFSMFPLLRRDGLVVAYIAVFGLYYLLDKIPFLSLTTGCDSRLFSRVPQVLFPVGVILILGCMLVQPPLHYPYIFEALISFCMFFFLSLIFVYSNVRQWSIPADDPVDIKRKMQ